MIIVKLCRRHEKISAGLQIHNLSNVVVQQVRSRHAHGKEVFVADAKSRVTRIFARGT